jgi:tol-pal system protein YbgF
MSMRNRYFYLILSVVLLNNGCATAGGSSSQLENAVYQTHRMVQDLDRDLSTSLEQLNNITAELVTRIDTSDNETRKLISVAEENQYKLDTLQRTLDQLTATLYKHLNLSPPTTMRVRPTPTQPFGTPGTAVPPRPSTGQPGDVAPQPTVTPPTISTPPAVVPPTSAPVADADAHYRKAQELYGAEQYDAALRQFQEHIDKFPNSEHIANATYWRAHCYYKMGNYEKAVEGFDELRSKYPNSGKVPIAMHNEGVAYSRLGQNERAKALFQRLIREYPDDVATEGAREKLRQLQGLN